MHRPLRALPTLLLPLLLAPSLGCDAPQDESLDAPEDESIVDVDPVAPHADAAVDGCDADDFTPIAPESVDPARLRREVGLDLAAIVEPSARRERGPLRPLRDVFEGEGDASDAALPTLDLTSATPPPSELGPIVQIHTGAKVTRDYQRVTARVFRVCDFDGTRCATVTEAQVRDALDTADRLQYRSEGRLRFVLDPATDLSAPLHWDALNNDCEPVADLAEYTSEDANNDGVVDGADAAFLCPPLDDAGLPELVGANLEAAGSVAIYARGGYNRVAWDGAQWLPKEHSSGHSACEGHAVYLTKAFGGSNFASHELGHYFCSPHTHAARPGSMTELLDLITSYVIKDKVDPLQEAMILGALFDLDANVVLTGNNAYLNSYTVLDTPPDPAEVVYDKLKCALNATHLDATVDYGAPDGQVTYTFTPDRRNVMSYFMYCFGDDHYFSPDQIARQQAASYGHRASVVETVSVVGWENIEDVPIPPRPDQGQGPLAWVASALYTEAAPGTGRVRVHVDIQHDTGGLDLVLVAPNGLEIPLQDHGENYGGISGDVKTIFFVPENDLPRTGVWQLKVAAFYPQFGDATRKIDDWRIEFE